MFIKIPLYERHQVPCQEGEGEDDVWGYTRHGDFYLDPNGLKTFSLQTRVEGEDDEVLGRLGREFVIFSFNYSEKAEDVYNFAYPIEEKETLEKALEQILVANASVVKDFGGA